VDKVRKAFEEEVFQKQKEIEAKALAFYKKNPKKARKFLTQYSNDWMNRLTKAYWKLGDDLLSKYTGKF
jgi:dipeptidase